MHIQVPPLLSTIPEVGNLVKPIIVTALQAVEPGAAVKKAINFDGSLLEIAGEAYNISEKNRVFVISFGKAALPMANATAEILGERLNGGVVIAKSLAGRKRYPFLDRYQVYRGNHPVPGKLSLEATRKVIQLVNDKRRDDLFICLISGGGSSLFTWPLEGITLTDLQQTTQLLLSCGADIEEMNVVRKHMDRVKGGGLCRLIHPAQMVTLVLSDVVGNKLEVIASGPTTADDSTFSDAMKIIDGYGLQNRVPGSVRKLFELGALGLVDETVRLHDSCMRGTSTRIIASNFVAAKAVHDLAKAQGWEAMILTTALQGEARQAGINLAGILRETQTSGFPIKPPACIIAGGETTVTVKGDGLGGRNLEVALGAVRALAGLERVLLFTLSTDGEDGPTDAAGAVVTGKSFERARQAGLNVRDYLLRNDAYRFFAALGDLIKTGHTGTNVNDLTFLLSW